MNLPIELILGIVAAIGTIWTIATYFLPPYQEYKKNKILTKKLGGGPYDESTIHQATKYYIKPKYSEKDPSLVFEPLFFSSERKDLFDAIDSFLYKDTKHRHLFVLADSGMGKTSFVINYFARALRLSRQRMGKISIVPLGVPNADEWIRKAASSTNSIIFLDGFDEDVRAVNNIKSRIDSLMQMCQPFKKVIITCRTQFFKNENEIPWSTGLSRIEPASVGDSKEYRFVRYYLSPFNNRDIKQYINKRISFWNRSQKSKAFEIVNRIPLLSVRPMLLAHIPDLLATKQEFKYSYQIYEAMIDAWIRRESIIENKDDLREFSNLLAVDLYVNRGIRGAERIPYNELAKIAHQWKIPLEQWKLSSRSLLNRDSDGNYKFAHRSIMEYLFVRQLIDGNEDCYGVFLTDQMIMFLEEMLSFKFSYPIKYQVTAINSLSLLTTLINRNVNNHIETLALSVARGLAWGKISSALCLQIDKIIRAHNTSIDFFKVSDWAKVEEKFVSLANLRESDDDRMKDFRQLSGFLINMSQAIPEVAAFEEVPELDNFIAGTFVGALFELGINGIQAENKILNILDDKAIYFWGENAYWNLWYRIALLSFLGKYGTNKLQDILAINDNVLLVPLINERGGVEGVTLAIKNGLNSQRG
jgi:hypothetical protein